MFFVHFMKEGGPFMYVILTIGLVGIAISIERLLYLSQVKKQNKAVWAAMQGALQKGNFVDLQAKLKSNNAEVSRVLETGLQAVNSGGDAAHIESAFEEGLLETIPRVELRINYLGMLSNLATLSGLLGTVAGMIKAFKSVATADPALKGDLLSASISEAMNCTAFGLSIAIILILAFVFIHNYSQQIIESLEMISLKVQNQVRGLKTPR